MRSTPVEKQIDQAAVSALRESLAGEILDSTDKCFDQSTKLFNSNVASAAKLVARPRNADDVSKVVKFCHETGLSLSVKSGGYGTHGWAIAGEVTVDLHYLNGVKLSLPNVNDTHISLAVDKVSGYSRETSDSSRKRNRTDAFEGILDPSSMDYTLGGSGTSASGSGSGSASRSGNGDVGGSSSGSGSDAGSGARDDTGWGRIGRHRSHSSNVSRDPQPESFIQACCSARNEDPIVRSPDEAIAVPSSTLRTNMPFLHDHYPPSQSYYYPSYTLLDHDSASVMASSSSSSPSPFTSTWTNPNFDDSLAPFSFNSSTLSNSASSLTIPLPPLSNLPQFSSSESSTPALPSASVLSSTITTQSPIAYSAFPSTGRPVPETGAYDDAIDLSTGPYNNVNSSSALVNQFGAHLGPFFYPRNSITSSSRAATMPSRAYATFGAGLLTKEIDEATSSTSLGAYHVPLPAFPVGAGAMTTGGFGFLSREYGLSLDCLVEVEMVLADGSIQVVNEHSDPELWWAIRGFGPSLGIFTRYTALAYPIPVVFSGNIIFPFNRATAPSLLKHYRDCVKAAPRKLYANLILTAGPDGDDGVQDMVNGRLKDSQGGAVVIIQLCWNGGMEEGTKWVEAICSWTGEQCLFKDVMERSFVQQQNSIANVLRGGQGKKWFIKSDLLSSLTDEIIHDTIRMFKDIPDGCSWLFELAGGALEDNAETCFPLSRRSAKFNILALHQWPVDESPEEDERCMRTADDWITQVIEPESVGGPIPCFINQNSPTVYVASSYGAENWKRLGQIKKRVDPTNLFQFSLGGSSDVNVDGMPLADGARSKEAMKGKGKATRYS
ncbi:fad linked oxidase domain-containing protein [Phaffia rhodozyma]|uniref:Fad linked oxidase domain-containing protein n=1 Tax=Phaffia rhodozyma TaxID=264483 RepID=A0A0F7SIU0_PHARH|nr:fad linked oxidase domain-containing protein [Phaffia rhodozyma]